MTATISVVLRVLSEPAAEGRLVGQAEVVSTGELVAVRAADELVDLVRRLVDPEPLGPAGGDGEPMPR
jgi:hypothetical protein